MVLFTKFQTLKGVLLCLFGIGCLHTTNAQQYVYENFGHPGMSSPTTYTETLGCGTEMTVSITGATHGAFQYTPSVPTDGCLNMGNTPGIATNGHSNGHTSPNYQSIDYTITFNPAVDFFEFSVHNIGIGQWHAESLNSFSYNGGTSLIQTTGLELNNADGLVLNGGSITPSVGNSCGTIKINKQDITELKFSVERNYNSGHFLSTFSFKETINCRFFNYLMSNTTTPHTSYTYYMGCTDMTLELCNGSVDGVPDNDDPQDPHTGMQEGGTPCINDFHFKNNYTYSDNCNYTEGVIVRHNTGSNNNQLRPVLHKLTFTQPVNNFSFTIHDINDGSNDESIEQIKVNGVAINLTSANLNSHNLMISGNKIIRDLNVSDNKGCGRIFINQSGINSISFQVNRRNYAGHFLGSFKFESDYDCLDPNPNRISNVRPPQTTSFTVVNNTSRSSMIGEDIEVNPNPTTGNFRLVLPQTLSEEARISIINLQGQVIRSLNQVGVSAIELDLSDEAAGLYFIYINHRDKVITKKVMLTK